MKLLISIVLSFISFFLFSQENQSWKQKVSLEVFNQFYEVEEVEYLVQMDKKADLSLAKTFSTKYEKTSYVYDMLKRFAENNQKGILSFCKANHLKYKSFFIVNAVLVKSDFERMKQIAQRDDVKFVEANPSVKLNKLPHTGMIENRSPNTLEWGIDMINADDVWDMGYTGDGVVVGGQDTGYRWTHEALKSKYRGWDGSTADHNYNWHDAIDSIDSHNSGTNPCGLSIKVPCDDQGHGTHTMGTMVGLSGSNEIGVAPDAKWIGCRNMERGYGMPSTYIECFEWFLSPTDTNEMNADATMAPDVVNNSWYCPETEGCDNSNYSTMEDAVNNLRDAGVVVVVSAGNSGPNCSTINTPPNFFSSSFDVGATNSSDTIANFSSRGPTSGYGSSILKPNIVAPGVSVRSSTYDNDSSYGVKSGTSMAGPHVAGAVALLISAFPSFKGDPDTIEHILENSAVFLDTDQSCGGVDGTETPNNTYGYGRLDILAAINYVNSLPLEIISFKVEKISDKRIKISWQIKSKNGEVIEIQKSKNGILWEKLSKVDFVEKYTLYDDNPYVGINYYRLKITSEDGLTEFSEVRSVDCFSKIQILTYPTVLHNGEYLNLEISDEKGNIIILDIVDSKGTEVFSKKVRIESNRQLLLIPISEKVFMPGLYFLKFVDKNNSLFLIQKIIISE